MEIINENTIPEEIEVLKPYAPYLMWEPEALTDRGRRPNIAEWHERFPTWSTESIIYGLRELAACAERGQVLYDVYSPEEVAADPSKEHVKLWFMPSKIQPSRKPFVLSYAGGGYTCVCSDAESFAVAARMTELGYNVFIPTYRVGIPALMPGQLEDISAALSFIYDHAGQFGLHDTRYILNGFSAGAHLICMWGLENVGWAKFCRPAPLALFPIYTISRFSAEDMDEQSREMISMITGFLFGSDCAPGTIEQYDVLQNMTAAYPPCYLVHAKDDGTVDYRNSTDMAAKLDELGIPHVLELIETGDHGFGDGRGTAAYGWVDRALRFAESLA